MSGKLIIFWDFDAQWGAENSRSAGGAKSWGPLDFENTERLLEIHAQAGIPACFAIVGAVGLPGARPRHDPALVRRIAAAGHEIASHSMQHEWLPGLGYPRLLQSLRDSKDALEQAAGCAVQTFVPPFNQPFDYPRRGSISLSERRQARQDRIDLPRLCQALGETGYRICRVSYSPLFERLLALFGRRRPAAGLARLETIRGLPCLRLASRAGFGTAALSLLDAASGAAAAVLTGGDPEDEGPEGGGEPRPYAVSGAAPALGGGLVLVYGHPHSLTSQNPQNERALLAFLLKAGRLIAAGQLTAILPGQLAAGTPALGTPEVLIRPGPPPR